MSASLTLLQPAGLAGARFQVLAGGRAEREAAPRQRFTVEALAGRFVELSGLGHAPLLSMALRLVLEAQRRGENVVWVGTSAATFYACDAAAHGIDLAALPVVMPPAAAPGAPQLEPPALMAGRAASHLLRSGAFGLVVLDLSASPSAVDRKGDHDLPLPLQSRLTGLAQKHGTLLLVLTRKGGDQPSLGSLVSLHARVGKPVAVGPPRAGETSDGHARYRVELDVIKDKRHGPGWSHHELFRAPDGLG